jgi:hypothetical protein
MFFITNLPDGLDPALLDRIYLKVKYNDLTFNVRRRVFINFLIKDGESVNIIDEEWNQLAKIGINSR